MRNGHFLNALHNCEVMFCCNYTRLVKLTLKSYHGTKPKKVELVQRFGIYMTWSSKFTYSPHQRNPRKWNSSSILEFTWPGRLWLTYSPPPIREILEIGTRPAFWNLHDLVCAGPYGPNWSKRWSSILLSDPCWWPLEENHNLASVKPHIQVFPPFSKWGKLYVLQRAAIAWICGYHIPLPPT